eukprot:354208-Chlamydomonas_euryale.AAC.10
MADDGAGGGKRAPARARRDATTLAHPPNSYARLHPAPWQAPMGPPMPRARAVLPETHAPPMPRGRPGCKETKERVVARASLGRPAAAAPTATPPFLLPTPRFVAHGRFRDGVRDRGAVARGSAVDAPAFAAITYHSLPAGKALRQRLRIDEQLLPVHGGGDDGGASCVPMLLLNSLLLRGSRVRRRGGAAAAGACGCAGRDACAIDEQAAAGRVKVGLYKALYVWLEGWAFLGSYLWCYS